jgi:hypothetical protein
VFRALHAEHAETREIDVTDDAPEVSGAPRRRHGQ